MAAENPDTHTRPSGWDAQWFGEMNRCPWLGQGDFLGPLFEKFTTLAMMAGRRSFGRPTTVFRTGRWLLFQAYLPFSEARRAAGKKKTSYTEAFSLDNNRLSKHSRASLHACSNGSDVYVVTPVGNPRPGPRAGGRSGSGWARFGACRKQAATGPAGRPAIFGPTIG
ncbi:uncharacterized protein THITE_2084364 [Thermothielavioides terrestris NRRL 8126]|uniref:Uncharacterized protein n=1 Tax=Thermothielavioides terrestris (strain ATCC 38088 / NRRL 8126) TaxID=578455 RepID=G2QUA1_THETT|nr:uncharacterized protein THITE_2084364 [Thermothielavioides terrestris NRRL 8126]AEO62853.1 hypothetical protein THITE_2084364 [Thermothielavioides terrestris NRRL 8126]